MSSVGFKVKAILSRVMAGAALATLAALAGSCAGGGGGIIGTGVQTVASGTVTGFGSVVVDGVHYSAAPGASVLVEGGSAATEGDLQIGMNVVLNGSYDSATGTGTYQSIEYRSDLTGPVQGVDPVAGTVVVLGQTVVVDPATILDGIGSISSLPAGAVVQVSGVLDLAGRLQATRLFLAAPALLPGGVVKLKGRIASAAAGSFTIGAQQVSYSAGTDFVNITASELSTSEQRLIEVRGTLSSGVIVATRVERLSAITATANERVSVKGIVESGDVHSFRLNTAAGPLTVAGDGALITDGTPLSIQPGVVLEVVGTLGGEVLNASAIEVKGVNSVKLEGNVTAVDPAAKRVTLNGITVQVTADTVVKDSSADKIRSFTLADLAAGDHVQVGGALDTSVTPHRVIARKLERFDASSTSITEGFF